MDTSEYVTGDDRRIAKRLSRHPLFQKMRDRAVEAEKKGRLASSAAATLRDALKTVTESREQARSSLKRERETTDGLKLEIERLEGESEKARLELLAALKTGGEVPTAEDEAAP